MSFHALDAARLLPAHICHGGGGLGGGGGGGEGGEGGGQVGLCEVVVIKEVLIHLTLTGSKASSNSRSQAGSKASIW